MKLERRRKRARERKRAKRESESERERERETARERLKKMPRSETVPVFRKLKKKTNERTWRVYGLYCALARTGGNW